MRTRRLGLLVSALMVTGFSGCFCCGRPPCCPPAPYVPGCSCPPTPITGPAPCPEAAPLIPPPPAPAAPVTGPPPASAAPVTTPPPPPPPGPAPDVRPYEPAPSEQGSYYWQPAQDSPMPNPPPERGVRVPAPEQGGARYSPPPENGVRLGTPVPDHGFMPEKPQVRKEREMPRAPERPRVREERETPRAPEKPNVREERDLSPSLPVGIPQFALVKDRLASGLKPSIDGLDWLKDNGFQTLVHVHLPGEDDAADRKQVTKRGLKFLSLEVSPKTLSPTVVQEFARIVGDKNAYPLFVYDKDGMLAGGLWYLYFRTVENESDETATIRAARLGLKEDPKGEHKEMWLAIQKYLSEQAKK